MRLCTFLLTNAAAVAPDGGGVTVRTESAGEWVLLRIEDSGPVVAPELLPHLFEPAGAGREGTNRLEMAACRTIVRRLQGRIHAENRRTEGVTVVVDLPAAPG
jgi:signal transduction histidine kinase